jgi:metallo-beta-lactamase class B
MNGRGNSVTRMRLLVLVAVLAAGPLLARAQSDPQSRSENQPVAPFHIVGDIYYVGASDVTSFLIVTPAGDILLDGGFVQTAPQIEANIRKLGFRPSDLKILLNSHAHFDHAGGLAELKRRTGARLVAMQGDAALLARGGRGDFAFGNRLTFPPIKPDRVVGDGDTVTLGGVTLTAHLTAGHTRGCTTWTTTTEDHGKRLHVVFVGSMSVLSGYRLVGKESYPGMAADYEHSFRVLRSLRCDIFLGSHGQFFHLAAKRGALARSPKENPFLDPSGYRAYVDRTEQAFLAELRRQQAAASSRSSFNHLRRGGAGPLFASRGAPDPRNGLDPPQGQPPASERSASALMNVEHKWLAALGRRDVKTLSRILATEFIDSDWQGDAITRTEFLAYFARPLAHPQPASSQRFEDTKVRFLANGDVAIVTGVVVTERAASSDTGSSAAGSTGANSMRRSRFTDVFVWRDARWQAITGQETHF